MAAFVAHPSIRVKGSEDNYKPVFCTEVGCVNHKLGNNAHMHCPFCMKTDAYQDPLLLQAHYRVKHVDKGIEFAGLKILRCCTQCEIKGSIKGNKFFKGAHWHCYKCMNGFNRRDEALKHYRTHFRNPDTTFNIQITQDVHGNVKEHRWPHSWAQTYVVNESGDTCDDGSSLLTASVETVIDSNGDQTYMIIERDQEGQTKEDQVTRTSYLEKRVQDLESENEDMRAAIESLLGKLNAKDEEIVMYKQRQQTLIEQLTDTDSTKLQHLISSLRSQHDELLRSQLSHMRKVILPVIDTDSAPASPQDNHVIFTVNADMTLSQTEVLEKLGMQTTQLEDPVEPLSIVTMDPTDTDPQLAEKECPPLKKAKLL